MGLHFASGSGKEIQSVWIDSTEQRGSLDSSEKNPGFSLVQ